MRRLPVLSLLLLLVVGVFVAGGRQPARANQSGGTTDMRTQAAWLASGENAHNTCSIESGQLFCWGVNTNGQLGYGNVVDVGGAGTPSSAGAVSLGAGRTATAVAVGGGQFTCAILDTGDVRCWGQGTDGQTGHGDTTTIGDDETPGSVATIDIGTGRTATAISAGGSHTCVILDAGDVRCWGTAASGQTGHGNTTTIGDNETPGSVATVDIGSGRTATAIASGFIHTCAILDTGAVRCWGAASSGQLGYGNTTTIGDNETPGSTGTVDLGTGRTATAITAGFLHTCAILDTGDVRCWGDASSGQTGHGDTTTVGDNETPGSVATVDLGAGRTATAIAAGSDHTCALLDDGTVRCWGQGGTGRLGYANTTTIGDNETPGSIGTVDLGTGRTAVAITAGDSHTCARLDDGRIRCWGNGANGRLGYANTTTIGDNETPGSIGTLTTGGTTLVPPSAPTGAGATAGDGQASLSWTAPTSTGGSAITGYRVTVSPTTGVTGGASRTTGAGTTSLAFTGLTNGSAYTFTVRATNATGSSLGATSSSVTPAAPATTTTAAIPRPVQLTTTTTTMPTSTTTTAPPAPTVEPAPNGARLSDGSASWSVDAKGKVSTTGTAKHEGDASGRKLNAPVAGIGVTPSMKGYWLVGEDGGVFTYGDARFYGSLGSTRPDAKVVDLVPSTTGKGYLLVDAKGRVTAFGDADDLGDRTGKPLAAPVVGLTPTASGNGYWLLGEDGGVFTYGDARFFGAKVPAGRKAVLLVPSATGRGYVIHTDSSLTSSFGDATGT